MATSITQIPTDRIVNYTGTGNEYDNPVPTNYLPILPIVIEQSTNIVSLFKVKFILRIYKDSVSDDNLLSILKQRPNGHSTTTNTVSIFDTRSVINTAINHTFQAIETGIESLNNPDKLFATNDNSVQTIIFRANWEYSSTKTAPAIEQTGASDIVELKMYFIQGSFPLFSYDMDTNPYDEYKTNTSSSFLLSSLSGNTFADYRHFNQNTSSSGVLTGHINYLDASNDKHVIAFFNKSGWGSDGDFLRIVYYDSSGSQVGDVYTIKNVPGQGGVSPSSATNDSNYMLFARVGTKNLNNYVGVSYKDNAYQDPFDGQPDSMTGWAYYTVTMVSNQDGTGPMSQNYYFVNDGTNNLNCKGYKIVRLGWINSVGGWDYFNFKGGQVETIETDRQQYKRVLGSSTLDSSDHYDIYNYEAGNEIFALKSNLKSRLETQFICEEEAVFLESLFNSPAVMIIQNENTSLSQRVTITKKDMERKTAGKDKLQIKYSFEIEYSNRLNVNI